MQLGKYALKDVGLLHLFSDLYLCIVLNSAVNFFFGGVFRLQSLVLWIFVPFCSNEDLFAVSLQMRKCAA